MAIFLGGVIFSEHYSSVSSPEEVVSISAPSVGANEKYAEDSKSFKIYKSNLGFSFEYPEYMFVDIDPEEPERLLVFFNSTKENPDGPVSGVIIATAENNPVGTPTEWMSGEWMASKSVDSKGALIGPEKRNIDGQEAISMHGGHWIGVNTPDNKRRVSIALFATPDSDSTPFAEMGIIVNSLTFTR